VKITVYTAIFGNIDKLWGADTHGVRHVAYVDNHKQEFDIATKKPAKKPAWEQIVLPAGWDNRRTARHYKAVPHYYMPDSDVWIWVDGNVRLTESPQEIVKRYLHSDFATFKHPDRDCLYAEADFCALVKKDSKEVLMAQKKRYQVAGMPKSWGLAETRVVIRRNTPKIHSLNNAWWLEIENYSLRDQVSLPFVCWKRKMPWEVIPGRCGPIRPKGPFKYMRHKL